MRASVVVGLMACFVLAAAAGLAQRLLIESEEAPRPQFPRDGEFHFVRLQYDDLPQFHRRWGFASRRVDGSGWWMVDWPDADDHFSSGVARLTRIQTGEPRSMRLTDDRIFDHPWIYATQAGWWNLNDREVKRLREYLLRGGFLVVDDFWGSDQWEVFRQTMERALPGEAITEIDDADPLMHVVYTIAAKDRTTIPGTRHLRVGSGGAVTVRYPEGAVPAWRSLRDPKGRIVVAVNFDTDVGDAWEYADSPEYPEAMTALAYRYGINYLVYSMTH
jgi:hypothetical protein